jgi:hypothetical protein
MIYLIYINYIHQLFTDIINHLFFIKIIECSILGVLVKYTENVNKKIIEKWK